jgi:hypothetical protein
MSIVRRSALVLSALGILLTLGACQFLSLGSDYGALHTDSTLSYASIGGFPSSGLGFGSYYSIPSGTHDVYYVAKYGSLYYPGNWLGTGSTTYSLTYVYHYTYTVYGTGRSFDLYLNHNGMGYSGNTDVVQKSLGSPSLLGSHEYKLGDAWVVVKGEILELSPEALASLPVSEVAGQ